MEVQTLRFWGLVAGSALTAFALWVAALGPEVGAVDASTPPAHESEAPATPVSFLVRFRGSGPIARAQVDARRGRVVDAQRRIESELRRQRAFAGLCFEHFTAGGAEIVLRTCEAASPQERDEQVGAWLGRLRDMRAVAYAHVDDAASVGRAE